MIEPSERGTFDPLGGKSCVHSTTRMNMLSIFFYSVYCILKKLILNCSKCIALRESRQIIEHEVLRLLLRFVFTASRPPSPHCSFAPITRTMRRTRA